MNAPAVALLTSLMVLASCPSSAQFFFFQNPVTLDNLDGNYRTIASCAFGYAMPETRAVPVGFQKISA